MSTPGARPLCLVTLILALAAPGCADRWGEDDDVAADDDDATAGDDDTTADDDDDDATGDDDTTAGDDDTTAGDDDTTAGDDDDDAVDCDQPGRIVVEIDGVTYFDRSTDRLLICEDLAFSPDQYGNGPPGAQIQVVHDDPGYLEALLLGFEDDHHNCEEKWGFVYLAGTCADVWLEKWNWNACNVEYQTDLMKLETWIDMDGDCSYGHDENDEPYSNQGVHWDPSHAYTLQISWE